MALSVGPQPGGAAQNALWAFELRALSRLFARWHHAGLRQFRPYCKAVESGYWRADRHLRRPFWQGDFGCFFSGRTAIGQRRQRRIGSVVGPPFAANRFYYHEPHTALGFLGPVARHGDRRRRVGCRWRHSKAVGLCRQTRRDESDQFRQPRRLFTGRENPGNWQREPYHLSMGCPSPGEGVRTPWTWCPGSGGGLLTRWQILGQ